MKYDNHILVPYPDEDLFEDGELDESTTRKASITPVQEKALWLLSTGRAVLAVWQESKDWTKRAKEAYEDALSEPRNMEE